MSFNSSIYVSSRRALLASPPGPPPSCALLTPVSSTDQAADLLVWIDQLKGWNATLSDDIYDEPEAGDESFSFDDLLDCYDYEHLELVHLISASSTDSSSDVAVVKERKKSKVPGLRVRQNYPSSRTETRPKSIYFSAYLDSQARLRFFSPSTCTPDRTSILFRRDICTGIIEPRYEDSYPVRIFPGTATRINGKYHYFFLSIASLKCYFVQVKAKSIPRVFSLSRYRYTCGAVLWTTSTRLVEGQGFGARKLQLQDLLRPDG
ncbi:hypothetical protein C8J56DRAFT_1053423 [Mycena floridula]|nr:hypothetical protein C8J56DRAFT_1053423 [Mycena floridula]